jgi:hypothetical protein
MSGGQRPQLTWNSSQDPTRMASVWCVTAILPA